MNIRGHIYLALDLRRLLGMPATVVTGDSRLVLFKPSVGSAFGVVVDEISDIQTADSNRIEAFTRNDHEAAAANVQPRRPDRLPSASWPASCSSS